MKRNSTKAVWPLLCVVTVLFVLSVIAPRRWRAVALVPVSQLRDGTQEDVTLAQATTCGAHDDGNPTPQSSQLANQHGDDPVELPAEIRLLSPDEVQSLISEGMNDGLRSGEPENEVPQLDDYATPRRVVEIGPQVTKSFKSTETLDAVAPPRVAVEPGLSLPPSSGFVRLAFAERTPRTGDSAWTIVRRAPDSTADIVTHWPFAPTLSGRLEALSAQGECAAWCGKVLNQLRTLASAESLDAKGLSPIFDQLHGLSQEAVEIADASDDDEFRCDLARMSHAISRRLVIWEQVSKIASAESIRTSFSIRDSLHRREVIDALEAVVERMHHSRKWRDYLMVDKAKSRFYADDPVDIAECRKLAKRILLRLEYAVLTPGQRTFLAQPEIKDYVVELRHLAAEPVDHLRLLDELERYESERTPEHALYVAAAQQICRWSEVEEIAELGRLVDAYYRNANIRVSVSGDLVNRLVPTLKPRTQEVSDVILGVPTMGQSETLTRAKVRLLPSERSWRFLLEVKGEVFSQTYSQGGPATFYNAGESAFQAQKQVIVHPYGITDQTAQAVADSSSTLTGMETRLDGLPLFGDIAQAVALRRYRESAPMARWEAENKIAAAASTFLDEKIGAQLEQKLQQFADHFYRPLQRLALNPVAKEMRTTDKRIIARYRMAGYHQLAAHTPRPLAPSDSLMSVQIHESALNNAIEQFGWEGKRAKPEDLYREVAKLFRFPARETPEDVPDNVTIRFAEQDPLRLSFQKGRATLTLALAELRQGKKRWRNFVVRVHYRSAPEQPDADLVRDQYVELIGKLGIRDQVALRGVFSRVFTRAKPFNLITNRLKSDTRLDGLRVSQLAIGDGWMGVAIGPR